MTESSLEKLLRTHLTDLQLANDPNQYLIGRVIARLMLLESLMDEQLKKETGHGI